MHSFEDRQVCIEGHADGLHTLTYLSRRERCALEGNRNVEAQAIAKEVECERAEAQLGICLPRHLRDGRTAFSRHIEQPACLEEQDRACGLEEDADEIG